MRRRSLVAGLGVLAFAIAVVVLALTGTSRGGGAAPPLPRAVLQPPAVTLASLRGHPSIVHFFASWCTPCTQEAPHIAKLSEQLHGRATLVGVDYSDVSSSGLTFVHEHHWSFPILSDPKGFAGEKYGIVGLPTTFVLDSRAHIVKRLTGPQSTASILAALPR
jgi:cytochrome c biogenesis protein CcmG, thiol:disulfide interchange protein DsbE